MANPMLQMLSNPLISPQAPLQQPNSPMGMLQQFQQFRQEMAGRSPQQIINQMLQSGQMSQQQFQSLQQQAQGLLSMFHR